jgi:glycosyltransferase involved in cell wall biosynthesis
MVDVYSAADVFVVASWREGFSRAGMEAAACGRAIIATDIRGCRELGTHDVDLLLVPARDPDALTAAVAALIDDPLRRAALGRTILGRAHQEFDQVRVAATSRAAYERVLGRRVRQTAER